MVQISYRGELQTMTGKSSESIDAAIVKDVLRYIKASYGAAAWKTAKAMLIVVNSESILLRKVFNTTLDDGDIVSFLPICGGG